MSPELLASGVTDENVQDIVETASYGGITYWASQPLPREFEDKPDGCDYTIVEAHEEMDGREVYYLTKDDVRTAYGKLLDLDQKYVNRTIHGYFLDSWRDRDEDGIDCGHIDATAADCIIQLACLGEIRYG